MEKFEKNMPKEHQIIIPDRELTFEAVRSSGPGGQNVNRVSTKVRLRWNIKDSAVLTEEEKEKIKRAYSGRITEQGEFKIECQETRSQAQNKVKTVERLHQLVAKALTPEKKRVPTKVPRRAKESRLKEKKKVSEKKKLRQKPKIDF